ncbi:unnamed protein product [Prorocentrum cordatum]|uniref:Uncharacterized protein n=1 Tax=Prorocentrum cordatum TaxID=2364126 RepID=A0ABN9RRG3_9DINO|nr:unnamed protein product [Polarella glacialis]
MPRMADRRRAEQREEVADKGMGRRRGRNICIRINLWRSARICWIPAGAPWRRLRRRPWRTPRAWEGVQRRLTNSARTSEGFCLCRFCPSRREKAREEALVEQEGEEHNGSNDGDVDIHREHGSDDEEGKVTTILTVSPPDASGAMQWQLGAGKLSEVTHLPCRTGRYSGPGCTPANAKQSDFPVRPGALMPPVQGCNKVDYAVLFVLGVAA